MVSIRIFKAEEDRNVKSYNLQVRQQRFILICIGIVRPYLKEVIR